MGLFRRSSGTRVAVVPGVVSPRQILQATVTTDKPIDKVSSATLEWGYTNFYRCRWAGRADAMATEMNDSWFMIDQVGTDAGSEKDAEDWVGVAKVELPVSAGQFAGGSSSFTVPSWAPGSSDVLARWSARLTIARGGRDVDTRGDFTVVIGRDDLQVTDAPQQRTAGAARPTSTSCCHHSSIARAKRSTAASRSPRTPTCRTANSVSTGAVNASPIRWSVRRRSPAGPSPVKR